MVVSMRILKYADPAYHGHDPKDIKKGDILWGK